MTLNKIKRHLHKESDIFLRWNFESLLMVSEIPNTPIRPSVSSRRKLKKKYQHVVFKGN